MTTRTPPNMNHAWAALMIRRLKALGADHFFVSPGSRSTPLAIAVAEYGGHAVVHFDERGAAFAALGCARATRRPAVVITTSGTAAANLLPAICEASLDHVPLIVITADRPPELRDTSANQTMNQVGLFGSFPRWFVDLPCPTTEVEPAFVSGTVEHAVARAMGTPPGPVHINQMFREPLAPDRIADGAAAWLKRASEKTTTRYAIPSATLSADVLLEVSDYVASARRGLVVAGSLDDSASSEAAGEMARRLGWPLLPDIRSGLRLGSHGSEVIPFADQVLLSRRFAAKQKPDVILHLGGRITSKRIQQFIAASGATIIMVDPRPERCEQGAPPSIRVPASVPFLAAQLPSIISRSSASWLNRWRRANRAVEDAWRAMQTPDGELSEPLVAACLSAHLGKGHALVLGNSMPIRDMEMYGVPRTGAPPIHANRGVSGIDGTVATSFGVAIGSGAPVTALVGDLTLLHDLNSLALSRRAASPVILVAVNNDGGGIFHFLPVSEHTAHFETCFGTPHGLGFRAAAAMFGLEYARPTTVGGLVDAYQTACRSGRSWLIEVVTRRSANLAEHRRIQSALVKRVDHAG